MGVGTTNSRIPAADDSPAFVLNFLSGGTNRKGNGPTTWNLKSVAIPSAMAAQA